MLTFCSIHAVKLEEIKIKRGTRLITTASRFKFFGENEGEINAMSEKRKGAKNNHINLGMPSISRLLEPVQNLRFCRFSGSFEPIFDLKFQG